MPKPKLFIGSSQKNIAIAEAFKNNLDDFIEVQIWDQDIFVNNQSFLESLLASLNAFDYALFIYATDDTILKKDKPSYSPRDNVVFESGLYMGSLGPSRVFVVYDEANDLKIPTDFAGISLFSFDSKMMKRNRAASVNKACIGIKAEIKKQTERYPYLKGKWRSKYKIPFMEGMPETTEEVRISAYRDGVIFESVKNSLKDYYTAYGKVDTENDTISGEWESRENDSDKNGSFMLLLGADRDTLYGYFTSNDQRNGVLFASWLLTKVENENENEDEIDKRLSNLHKLLNESTILMIF